MAQGRQSPSMIPVHGMHHLLLSSYSSHSLKPPPPDLWAFIPEGLVLLSSWCLSRSSAVHQESRWHADKFNLVNMGEPDTSSSPDSQWHWTAVGGWCFFFLPFFINLSSMVWLQRTGHGKRLQKHFPAFIHSAQMILLKKKKAMF